ncbi:DUF7343 domain-containing protein [Haladaptatus sp. DFWS20]|uniref:helix-turn-helix transcriptional regulator n=1 Tax=Haladaptatus sp. DFWS20 TaxID=3403467 RepID=UPI003EBD2E8D
MTPAVVATPPSGNQLVIQNVTYEGAGVVETGENVTYLWQSESHSLSVIIYAGNRSGDHEVCTNFKAPSNNTTNTVACRDVSLSPNTVQRVNFSFGGVPQNVNGQQTAIISVENGGSVLSEKSVPVYAMVKSGDEDGDQLTNQEEVELGTNVTSEDTDKDGLKDRAEVVDYETNATNPDTDADGLRDAEERNAGTNPNRPDTDADGLDDGREQELRTNASAVDTDDDGLTDVAELNGDPKTDPTNNDTDGDGINDADELGAKTDPTESDTDGDGLDDGEEKEHETDPTKADTDGDGLNDAKEIEVGTNPHDSDTDDDGLDDGFEHQFGTNPKSPVIAGGLYIVLLSLLIGGAVLFQRNGTNWVSELLDSTDRQEQKPKLTQTNEVVTDADRVLELLRENGGRLPQGEIIQKTGWSKSKVSRLLSKMEDKQQVSKINIGRKNIVILYGQEPGNMGSSSE